MWLGRHGVRQAGRRTHPPPERRPDKRGGNTAGKPVDRAGQQGQATDALRRAQEQRPAATGSEDYDQTPPGDEIQC